MPRVGKVAIELREREVHGLLSEFEWHCGFRWLVSRRVWLVCFEDSFRRCEAFHDAEARWLWARVATSCLIAMSAFCARREKEEEES